MYSYLDGLYSIAGGTGLLTFYIVYIRVGHEEVAICTFSFIERYWPGFLPSPCFDSQFMV